MLELTGVTEMPTNVSGSGKNFPQAILKSTGITRKTMQKLIRSSE